MIKFKVGDWVISTRGNIEQITCTAPRGCGNYYGEAEDVIINYRDSNDYDFIDSGVKLWHPQVGEFVVLYNFADGLQKSFRVAQFKQLAHGKGREGQYKDMQGNYFTHCEPFKGTLPTFIKDK